MVLTTGADIDRLEAEAVRRAEVRSQVLVDAAREATIQLADWIRRAEASWHPRDSRIRTLSTFPSVMDEVQAQFARTVSEVRQDAGDADAELITQLVHPGAETERLRDLAVRAALRREQLTREVNRKVEDRSEQAWRLLGDSLDGDIQAAVAVLDSYRADLDLWRSQLVDGYRRADDGFADARRMSP